MRESKRGKGSGTDGGTLEIPRGLPLCLVIALLSAVPGTAGAGWAGAAGASSLAPPASLVTKRLNSRHSKLAKADGETAWTARKPAKPECPLTTEIKAHVQWQAMKNAQSYVLYWSTDSSFETEPVKSTAKRLTTKQTSATHVVRAGEYGAQLPMYYRVAGVRNGVESDLSDACIARLLDSEHGTRCQICGDKAVGHCHLRDIYVCARHNTFTSDTGSHWRCP